jgi:hypothetical protein
MRVQYGSLRDPEMAPPSRRSALVVEALLAGGLTILLIVCANLINITLVDAQSRGGELAVRVSLGASKSAIARIVFLGSLMPALAGASLAAICASVAAPVLSRWSGLPVELLLDWRSVVVLLTIAVLAAAAIGGLPALRAARVAPRQVLQGNQQQVSQQLSRWQIVALITQVVIATAVCAIATGALARLRSEISRDRRMRVEGLSILTLALDATARSPQELKALQPREQMVESILRERLTSIVRPDDIAFAQTVPTEAWQQVQVPTASSPTGSAWMNYDIVSPNYFTVLGLRIVSGRAFGPSDNRDSPSVAVVNESMAKQLGLTGMPSARCLSINVDGTALCTTVVGVVEDGAYSWAPDGDAAPFFFLSREQLRPRLPVVAIVVGGQQPAMFEPIARGVVSDRVGLPSQVTARRFSEIVYRDARELRQAAFGAAALAVLTLVVGLTGVLGVLAFIVNQRSREAAIRLALGATPRQIVTLYARVFGAWTVGATVAGALIGASLLRWYMASLDVGEMPVMLTTMIAWLGVLLSIAAVIALPLRRASRLPLATVLRS